jgi:hypothetical protein
MVLYDRIVLKEKIKISEDVKPFLIKYCHKSYRSLLNQLEKKCSFLVDLLTDNYVKWSVLESITTVLKLYSVRIYRNIPYNNSLNTLYNMYYVPYGIPFITR